MTEFSQREAPKVTTGGVTFYISQGLKRLPDETKQRLRAWLKLTEKPVVPELEYEPPLELQRSATAREVDLVYQDPYYETRFNIPVWLGRDSEPGVREPSRQGVTLHLDFQALLPPDRGAIPADSDRWRVPLDALVRATCVFDLLEETQPERLPEGISASDYGARWNRHFQGRDGKQVRVVGMEVDRITTGCGQTWQSFSRALERSTAGCMKLDFSRIQESIWNADFKRSRNYHA
ncbi:MAG: hypothetical protein JW991_05605 [Candidatus Pacebacteria bacterium]|nr:hypothetical protein [Candidatus Paceibacterota bacterium]